MAIIESKASNGVNARNSGRSDPGMQNSALGSHAMDGIFASKVCPVL